MKWTDENLDFLKETWPDKDFSQHEIAERIGVSLSAMWAKVKELDLGKRPRRDSWSSEQIAYLKKTWPDSFVPLSKIVKNIGRSQNAVIGMAHRIGLGARPKSCKRTTKPTKTKTERIVPRQQAAPRKPAPKPKSALKLKVDLRPIPGAPATVADLSDGICRWPIGDPLDGAFRFCGREAQEVYCEAHMDAARM